MKALERDGVLDLSVQGVVRVVDTDVLKQIAAI